MARVLPPSPLLQNESFKSPAAPEVSQLWTWPIAPPIENSYGGNAGAMVHTLAVDPFNANIVYTGSFGGLAKTTDGGFTWQYLSEAWTSQSVSAIAVDPNASRIVYAGTGRDDYGPYSVGLYRSFDGGLTWSRPLGERSLCRDVREDNCYRSERFGLGVEHDAIRCQHLRVVALH